MPPKISEIAIEGQVLWENGAPAAGVEIKLFDQAFPGVYAGCYLMEIRKKSADVDSPVRSTSLRFTGSVCDLKSNSDGRFRLSAFSGRTYRLKASATKTLDGQQIEFAGESEAFSLIDPPPSIKLVLRKK
ncbi:MAG: hypothetical protein IPN69_01585 [Acidobacteria bacterium]|nr:hypothetical protein [Acidobacteriota bacterium]